MRRVLLPLCLLAMCGCDSDLPEVFTISRPAAGSTLSGCNVSVVTPPPGGKTSGRDVTHLAWRLNGGAEREAVGTNLNVLAGNRASYLFNVRLAEGANTLEVGRCDELGVCEWTPHAVTVNNTAGAPDCRAKNGGQVQLPPEFKGSQGGLVALADGRLLAASPRNGKTGLVMLSSDGSIDTTFGASGLVEIPAIGGLQALPLPQGGWLVSLGGSFARVSAAGVLDVGFGTTEGVAGLKRPSCAEGCSPLALAVDPQGGYFGAGLTPQSPGSMQLVPATMHLDADLVVSQVQVLDATRSGAAYDYAASSVDSQGHAAVLGPTFLASTAGATIALPAALERAAALVVKGSTTVLARVVFDGTPSLEVSFPGGGGPATKLPLGALPDRVLATIADDGSAWVVTSRSRATEAGAFTDATDASELLIARFRNGALDPTFGTGGVAQSTFLAAWPAATSENAFETPMGLAADGAGAAWVLALSRAGGSMLYDPARRREAVTLTKLRP